MTAPARKWIAKELTSLDPYTDYVHIWQLVSAYHVNRFQLSFFSNFPRPLHPVARAMVLSLYPDHIISTFRLERPTFVVRSTVRMLFRVMFLSTRFRRDPATTIWERRERAVTQAAAAAA